MVFGDIGGPVTELVLTCKSPAAGSVDIRRGDALKLTGPYEVDNALDDGDRIFGEALADCTRNAATLPVRVRGVCAFRYAGSPPAVDGVSGVTGVSGSGKVQLTSGAGAAGLAVCVNTAAGTVEVLL